MSDRVANLLAVGGAHIDRLARLNARHIAQTSNPVSITENVGGGSFNAARAAKRFNIDVSLLSARGGDAGGALVEEAVFAAGITDLSSVHLDRATPSYTAILEANGELVTAIADMGLYETSVPRSFKRAPVQKAAALADAILCDANLLEAGIAGVFADLAKGKLVYAMAISAGKAQRLADFLPSISCLFMNRFEAAALTGMPETTSSTHAFAEALRAKGLSRAVITAGAEPAVLIDAGSIVKLKPPQVKVVDVTGAGDCLAGTMIAALLCGSNFIDAAKFGLAAASLTASRQGAAPQIIQQEIEALAATHDWIIT